MIGERTVLGRRSVVAAVAVAVTSLVGAAGFGVRSAGAAQFDGVLGIHGPGAVYAGTDGSTDGLTAQVTMGVGNGGTASFPVEVVNTGTVTSQYQLRLYGGSGPVDYAIERLATGGVDVTALAVGQGYVTHPIAPGARQLLTLRIVTPKLATVRPNVFGASLSLADASGGQPLGYVGAVAVVRAGWGATDHDVLVSAGSQQKNYWMTAPTVTAGHSATFHVTTRNDTGTATAQRIIVSEISLTPGGCTIPFDVSAAVGGKDVTAAASGLPGYQTPVLSGGASFAMTVAARSVLPHPHAAGCLNTAMIYVDVFAGGSDSIAILYVNGAP